MSQEKSLDTLQDILDGVPTLVTHEGTQLAIKRRFINDLAEGIVVERLALLKKAMGIVSNMRKSLASANQPDVCYYVCEQGQFVEQNFFSSLRVKNIKSLQEKLSILEPSLNACLKDDATATQYDALKDVLEKINASSFLIVETTDR